MCARVSVLMSVCVCERTSIFYRGLLVGWLVSLFIQGKPLVSGYYSSHPETIQYSKDRKTKTKTTRLGQPSVTIATV